MMPNRPEYLALWLGITRTGAVVSLLNTNLTGPSLAHCINIAAPRHIIVAAALEDRFTSAEWHLTGEAKVWVHGAGCSDRKRIDQELWTPCPAAPSEHQGRPTRRALRSGAPDLHLRNHGACPKLPTSATSGC